MRIDVEAAVPTAEWPLPKDGPVRLLLAHGSQQRVLAEGQGAGTGWTFDFAKHLAADSQPFDVQAQARVGWAGLPWPAMAGWCALVAALVAGLGDARAAMAQAAQQARRASDVLGRLRRTVERPDVGSALQPLSLGAALKSALDLLEPDCRRLGVAPSVRCEPPTLAVQAEPVALEQIVHNLLSNALHALA